MLFKAIEFATKAHAGQYRKASRLPYIMHPLSVAKILIEYGCAEDVVVAGLLHDTVEDTVVSIGDIRREFGDAVARMVAGASEANKQARWETRKQQFIASLQNADADTLLVVAADKLDNIRSIRADLEKMGESVWTRFSRPKEKQRWYFRTLTEVLDETMRHEPGRALLRQFQKEVEAVFGDT